MYNKKTLRIISITLLLILNSILILSGCSGTKIKSIKTYDYEQIDNKADNYDKKDSNIILDEQDDKEISYKN